MNRLALVEAEALPVSATATVGVLPAPTAPRWDPRLYQIATLAGLLGYGIWWLDLEVQPQTAVTIVLSALVTQLVCTRLPARGPSDPRTALISGPPLCLLIPPGVPGLAVPAPIPAIPLHRLENGALVLFSFFMISDPRTTPDSRLGRVLFAALVALGAYTVQFWLFRTNGLLWSLAVCSLPVPLIDRFLPGPRFRWP